MAIYDYLCIHIVTCIFIIEILLALFDFTCLP